MESTCQPPSPGIAELIRQLDRAVELGDIHRTTAAVKRSLSDLIRAGQIELPPRFFVPLPHTYARRLLHRDDERGYNAIVMTWGPGQGTALHDHGGFKYYGKEKIAIGPDEPPAVMAEYRRGYYGDRAYPNDLARAGRL